MRHGQLLRLGAAVDGLEVASRLEFESKNRSAPSDRRLYTYIMMRHRGKKSKSKGRRMSMSANKMELAAATERDPRWAAVVARSAEADGSFFYSVRTTGVYCRPTCASRRARPENVRFHATREDAERAGFRPCQRCKPDRASLADRHAAQVTRACRLIETSDRAASLEELAKEAGVSPFHFHRVFKAATGLTPKAYAAAHRGKRVRAELGRTDSVTAAIYESGYNSNGRFYDESRQVLGMTPSDYRAGGAGAEIRFAVGECSLGSILVARSERGVCAILLGDDPDALARELQDRFPRAILIGGDAEFERVVAQVVGFVEAPGLGLPLPLDVRGTAFQQRVWQALREIPAGSTATYSEIAARIGAPKSVRAVAGACAANALAVAIPCHRVIRNDGGLSSYRWGVERKRALLRREATA
jgi:AraC family transcriptional regulator of adaptative response/methylated-DNA-[protein]-cysteine methyltransferase